MAQQISVNSATGNIQIQVSRGAIGPSTTANVANTALNLNATSTANVIIGGGVANYVLQTDGAGTTSWVAQTGGGATNPAGTNTQVQFNDGGSFGADATFTYDKTTDVLSATHFNGEGGNISNIAGANVSGTVASATLATYATTANTVAGANVSGAVANATHATISDSANSVAVANVAGIGNIATTNYDGNILNVLHGDGSWSADVTDYSNSNVVSLMAAFGSNTITTTGNVTTGNLEVIGVNGNVTLIPDNEIIGAKRYTTINRATASVTLTAGSFLIGEGYTIVTTGTTDFTLIGAADSNPGTIFIATGVGTGTGTAKYNNSSSQAFVTDNYTTSGSTNFRTYANTSAGNLARGGSFSFENYDAIGNANTDPLIRSIVQFTAYPLAANLANATTGTGTTFSITQPGADGFFTVVGSGAAPGGYLNDAWKQIQYRDNAIGIVRRNGNADARISATANDETSFSFYNSQQASGPGSVSTYNYPAKIGSKVDADWVDPQNGNEGIKNGLFFEVVKDNFDRIDHRMYSNGTVVFNEYARDYLDNPVATNPVTIGNDGVITGDGGGLSNIASANVSGLGNIATINIDGSATNVLYGNGVFAAASSPALTGDGYQLANLTGANVTGEVGFSAVANSVAYANVSGTPTLGNIATINIDGDAANVLYGNGAFAAAPAGATYGDSNVITLMGAFGSSPIFTSGLVTGDGGGLGNIVGANVSGAVPLATFATTANAVALANVTGSGNIASINIDGSAGNVLYGNGVFAAASSPALTGDGYQLANLTGANVSGTVALATTAVLAQEVINSAQPNIGSVGTLSTLLVSGNVTGQSYVSATTALQTTPVITSALPAAATAGAGARSMVTDADAGSVFGAALTGAGSLTLPVFSDGTIWRVG